MRGPDAFRHFIAALMSCDQQKFIAYTLDAELAKQYDSTDSDVSTTQVMITFTVS